MIRIEDRWSLRPGRIMLSGMQALVRLPLMQRARDAAAGLNTAGFISGYRGSPLGGYDLQLRNETARLDAANIRFERGVNEELAATAIWGTQQAPLLPGARYQGVFSIWYGKGPGVDRAGDAIKHGNRMGSSTHGGVLVVFGDDHPGKSSTTAHQSEQALAANGLPILYPATVQEYLDLGLHGFAMSRYAGVWVGFKCVNESAEATSTIEGDVNRVQVVTPKAAIPPGGVNAKLAFDSAGDEIRLVRHKLPLAQAYSRANGLDRVTHGALSGGLGIIAAGKAWLDVLQALAALGLDESRLQQLGIAVYKPALIWPLEPEGLFEFARGQRELLFVEEKTAFMEPQAAHILYNLRDGARPRICGKHDDAGNLLLRPDGVLDPIDVALAIGARLRALGRSDATLEARLTAITNTTGAARERKRSPVTRLPYFCAGCPHSTSTKVPDGSLALAGIGCHTMALFMDRHTLPPTHMGGEGVNWTGIAPFTDTTHVFQNLGDGTYFHSGLLAIRAAVNAGVNITYKILVNDAVAMTGGQSVEGQLSVGEITHQLRAERVRRIAVVSDDCDKYGRDPDFAPGTTIHDRSELDAVQRSLRQVRGVSAIVYDQVCAAEKRRRRKRGRAQPATRRVFINELVCEGCGDCSNTSNCVAVEPVETELGRKRRIDQSGCNQDYSCTSGFCPSFVTVEGARLRKSVAQSHATTHALPVPSSMPLDRRFSVLIAGIGGTGVVTVGALISMAAYLDGYAATVYDMTGLAQKGGAVLSHVKVARTEADLTTPRVGMLEADVVLACDTVAGASTEALQSVETGRTRAVLNTHLFPTASFQLDPDFDFRAPETLAAIEAAVGAANAARVDATRCAIALLGDAIAANVLVIGYALQKGWLPVSLASIERAIEMNGASVALNRQALELGRLAAHAPEQIEQLLAAAGNPDADARSERDALSLREEFLVEYQDRAYAARYRALVDRVAATERQRTPGRKGLTEAVTRYYFKLLAYKDEYEVARLHSSVDFRRQLATTFEGDYTLRFHLAPPGLTRSGPDGRPHKVTFGSWMLPVFHVLAKLRRLRGTRLDPFGYASERRMERALIGAYERTIDEVLAGLAPERHALAVELASLPERIRGFGPVKKERVEAARGLEAQLLGRWHNHGRVHVKGETPIPATMEAS